MSCKTCKRALLPEGHDENGNCEDCAKTQPAKQEKAEPKQSGSDAARAILGTPDES